MGSIGKITGTVCRLTHNDGIKRQSTFTTKLPRQTVCDHPEEYAPTMPALVNGAVHFKVIQTVHFILIYPVHLKVI